ncbi:formyltransferase family protein [Pedobacter sp.]
MKFGFVTCVQLGLSCIEKIYDIGGKLDVLFTLHDHKAKKKSGRIYLDEFSTANDVPLIKLNHINDNEVIEAIKEFDLDWLFIIGWSQIASAELLQSPKKGCIGMHPTLLPIGRGRAAIPWAIIKELDRTGVSMFVLDEGVDTGPILGQYEIPLRSDETATDLYNKVNLAHESLIAQVYPSLKNETYQLVAQDHSLATVWEGRTPSDGELNMQMSVTEVDRIVRATTKPYPGAYILLDGVKRIIWEGTILNSKNESSNVIEFKNGFYQLVKFEDVKIF